MAPKLFELLLLLDAVFTRRPSLVCLGLYSDKFNSFGVRALVKLAVESAALIEPGVVLIREHTNSKLGIRIPSSQFVRLTK